MRYSYRKSRMNSELQKAVNDVVRWKYKNILLLIVSIIVAYFMLQYKPVVTLIHGLSYLGYAAAFILGMFFTYALTTAPATVALYNLGHVLNPFVVALIGAAGSVISDYLIFRFVRDRLMDEIKLLSEDVNRVSKPWTDAVLHRQIRIWKKVSRSRLLRRFVPIIAGLIIASPLPDEFGVALLGAVRYEPKRFLVFSYCFNFLGILAISFLGTL